MPLVTLQLLGSFVLELRSTQAPVHIGRKAKALIACVAAHRDVGVLRSNLVALFWADCGESEARNSLRQCLYQIRRSLGDKAGLLVFQGDRVVLRESACDVDLWRFEQLAAQTECTALLAAANLFKGNFADGLDAGADWERWLTYERERLRAAGHNLLARLSQQVSATPDCLAAIRLARTLLVDDPLHEGCYRVMMVLHERIGLRAKALQLWDECRHVMRAELNVEPSGETRALYERLRIAGDGPSNKADATAPESGSGTSPGPHFQNARSVAKGCAFDHLLRGWQLYTLFTNGSNSLARVEFEAALRSAPDHPEALTMRGWTHFFDFISGWSDDTELSFRLAANDAALAIASNQGLPGPHALQGKVLLWKMDHEAALDQLRMGVEKAPDSAYAHFNLADATMWAGRYQEALLHIRRALRLDANDHGLFLAIQGMTLYSMGNLAVARESLSSAITRNPSYPWPYATMAALHAELGDFEEARACAESARGLNRRMSVHFAQRVLPIREAALRERIVKGWRLARMPEDEAGVAARSSTSDPEVRLL